MSELTEAGKRARAAYMRQWRRRNPERHKQLINDYWERKAARMEQREETEPKPEQVEVR